MGILDRVKRVDLGGGDWIEVRPLSVGEGRAFDAACRELKAADGESQEETVSYAQLELARERIVAWSDEAPVTPENTARLSIELNRRVWFALLSEDDDLPLLIGSPSTGTSEASPEA